MKTSTHELSNSQKWMLPIMLILALFLASCSDSAVAPEDDTAALSKLQGAWAELERDNQVNQASVKGETAELTMTPTSGILQIESDEIKIYVMFEYQIINSNVLQIVKTRNQVNGKPRPSGEHELVFYSLYDEDNVLQIFDRTFVRQSSNKFIK